jgi:hypothetical protein
MYGASFHVAASAFIAAEPRKRGELEFSPAEKRPPANSALAAGLLIFAVDRAALPAIARSFAVIPNPLRG